MNGKALLAAAAFALTTGSAFAQAAPNAKPWTDGMAPQIPLTRAFPNLTPIYRFTAARSFISMGTTVSTAVHCTNWGPAATVQINANHFNGQLGAAVRFAIPTGATRTASTIGTQFYAEDYALGSSTTLSQGSIVVYSTTPHVQCNAEILDAQNIVPTFVSPLASQRLNPAPGVTE